MPALMENYKILMPFNDFLLELDQRATETTKGQPVD